MELCSGIYCRYAVSGIDIVLFGQMESVSGFFTLFMPCHALVTACFFSVVLAKRLVLNDFVREDKVACF